MVDTDDRCLHDAGMFAEILQRRDIRRDRRQRPADERPAFLGAGEDPAILADRKDERAGIEHAGWQILAETLLRVRAAALVKKGCTVRLEGRNRDGGRKPDRLARTLFHAGVLVHDAGHARDRYDDQECDDEDRDGTLENGLRARQTPRGRSGKDLRLRDKLLLQAAGKPRKLESQPPVGCARLSRVRHLSQSENPLMIRRAARPNLTQ
ncbi:hypothetical protein D9M70_497390 [compost metagenome]